MKDSLENEGCQTTFRNLFCGSAGGMTSFPLSGDNHANMKEPNTGAIYALYLISPLSRENQLVWLLRVNNY